jgi:uncharacterized membrane protein YeaQ/YmgE (transglycosylase-associated protein family)
MPNLLWAIIIGIAAGWIAGELYKGQGFGLVGNLIVGVLGAVIGSLLFGLLGVSMGGLVGELIVAVIGAVVLLAAMSFVKRPHIGSTV